MDDLLILHVLLLTDNGFLLSWFMLNYILTVFGTYGCHEWLLFVFFCQFLGVILWFQPTWKICNRQIGSFPLGGRGENKKYLSCHHLEISWELDKISKFLLTFARYLVGDWARIWSTKLQIWVRWWGPKNWMPKNHWDSEFGFWCITFLQWNRPAKLPTSLLSSLRDTLAGVTQTPHQLVNPSWKVISHEASLHMVTHHLTTISGKRFYIQWLFLVPLKGGRCHIIPQLAVYTTYILPSGGLYNPYHRLGEPETTIDIWNIHKQENHVIKMSRTGLFLRSSDQITPVMDEIEGRSLEAGNEFKKLENLQVFFRYFHKKSTKNPDCLKSINHFQLRKKIKKTIPKGGNAVWQFRSPRWNSWGILPTFFTECLTHRENGGKTPWDGGPLIINPISTLYSGYLDVFFPMSLTGMIKEKYQFNPSRLKLQLTARTWILSRIKTVGALWGIHQIWKFFAYLKMHHLKKNSQKLCGLHFCFRSLPFCFRFFYTSAGGTCSVLVNISIKEQSFSAVAGPGFRRSYCWWEIRDQLTSWGW